MDPKEQLQDAYKEIRAGNFQKAEAIYKELTRRINAQNLLSKSLNAQCAPAKLTLHN